MERQKAAREEAANVEAEETPRSAIGNVADTEEVVSVEDVSEKETGADEVASRKEISELVRELKEANDKFSEDIRIRDDTIEKLNEKVRSMTKENEELGFRIVEKTMFYDTFKDEMRDKFGYDSDEEAERNWQEILRKEKLEKKKYSCEQCGFIGKSEGGLKTHDRKKHNGN